MNKCGVCYGTKEGTSKTSGMDVCGVCGGDGLSCKDCNGTPNGKASIDKCGECKDVTDRTRDTGCISLFSGEPEKFFYTYEKEIRIFGVGLDIYKSVKECNLRKVSGSELIKLKNSKLVKTEKGSIVVSNYDGKGKAGIYKIECTFEGDTEKTLNASKTIRLFGNPTITDLDVKTITQGSLAVKSGTATVSNISDRPVCFILCPVNVKTLPICMTKSRNSKILEKRHLLIVGCKKMSDTKLQIDYRQLLKMTPTTLNIRIANIFPQNLKEIAQ